MSNNEKAITPYEQLKQELSTPDVVARFEQALGEQRAGAYIVSVLNSVSKDDTLRKCDPISIIVSCLKAAVLDFPVDQEIGLAWIIPYWNSKRGIYEASFQIGYRGYIQLALRTGLYKTLNVALIFEGQEVEQDQLTGTVNIKGSPISDRVIGYVGFLKLINGYKAFSWWSKDQMREHAKRYAPTWGKGDDPKATSPWATDFDLMARTKVIKHLIKKQGLISISDANREALEQLDQALADDNEPTQEQIEPGQEPIDAEFREPDEPQHIATFIDPDEPLPEEGELEAHAQELKEQLARLEQTLAKKRAQRAGDDLSPAQLAAEKRSRSR